MGEIGECVFVFYFIFSNSGGRPIFLSGYTEPALITLALLPLRLASPRLDIVAAAAAACLDVRHVKQFLLLLFLLWRGRNERAGGGRVLINWTCEVERERARAR